MEVWHGSRLYGLELFCPERNRFSVKRRRPDPRRRYAPRMTALADDGAQSVFERGGERFARRKRVKTRMLENKDTGK
jgi:hypothetical protein